MGKTWVLPKRRKVAALSLCDIRYLCYISTKTNEHRGGA